MNDKITLQDLINLLVQKQNIARKDAEAFVKAMFNLIEEVLESERYVKVKGLGVFKLTEVESRKSVNVNTGERFEIQGHSKISFTPDSVVRDLINKPFSHFETVALNEGLIFDDTFECREVDSNEMDEEVENSETFIAFEEMENLPGKVEDEKKELELNKIISSSAEARTEVSQKITVADLQKRTDEIAIVSPYNVPIDEKLEYGKKLKSEETRENGIKLNKADTKLRKGWYVIFILLCICVLVGYKLYNVNEVEPVLKILDNRVIDPEPSLQPIPSKSLERDTLIFDTIRSMKGDNVSIGKEFVGNNDSVRRKTVLPMETLSAQVEYNIVGVLQNHTISGGETLRKISLRYYGSKELFTYIVQYNSDIIKNPNNVPIGTVIKIPKLKQK